MECNSDYGLHENLPVSTHDPVFTTLYRPYRKSAEMVPDFIKIRAIGDNDIDILITFPKHIPMPTDITLSNKNKVHGINA